MGRANNAQRQAVRENQEVYDLKTGQVVNPGDWNQSGMAGKKNPFFEIGANGNITSIGGPKFAMRRFGVRDRAVQPTVQAPLPEAVPAETLPAPAENPVGTAIIRGRKPPTFVGAGKAQLPRPNQYNIF